MKYLFIVLTLSLLLPACRTAYKPADVEYLKTCENTSIAEFSRRLKIRGFTFKLEESTRIETNIHIGSYFGEWPMAIHVEEAETGVKYEVLYKYKGTKPFMKHDPRPKNLGVFKKIRYELCTANTKKFDNF